MLLRPEADDLQDAGAGDVRHHIGHALPHAQQSATQHVVLTEAHALQTLLAFFYFLTLPIPEAKAENSQSHIFRTISKGYLLFSSQMSQERLKWMADCFTGAFLGPLTSHLVTEPHVRLAGYFFMTNSQVICKSLGMASDFKSTLTES